MLVSDRLALAAMASSFACLSAETDRLIRPALPAMVLSPVISYSAS